MTGEGESGRRRRRRRSAVTMEMGMVRGKKVRMVERRSMMVGGYGVCGGYGDVGMRRKEEEKKNLNIGICLLFFGGVWISFLCTHVYIQNNYFERRSSPPPPAAPLYRD